MARLQRLVRKLPPESATARSVHGLQVLWGPAEHLLAGTLDTLAMANWQRGGGKGSKPKPIDRPGSSERTKSTLSPREMEVRLLALNNRAGR